MGGKKVVAAGLGRIEFKKLNSEHLLRQANFVTLPADNENCSNHKNIMLDPDTIICAFSTSKIIKVLAMAIQVILTGFIRQPELTTFWKLFLIKLKFFKRMHGNDLIGVTSFSVETTEGHGQIGIQGFTNVAYYYRWIEHITGLEMPKCNGPQASIYTEKKFEDYRNDFPWNILTR